MSRTFTSALAFAITLGAWNAMADDTVCYQVNNDRGRDSNERLVLNIKNHSPLTTSQTAYSVHGKYVASCGRSRDPDMVTVTGTIVTLASTREAGARLGVETQGVLNNCVNTTFDCTSERSSAAPDQWQTCAVRKDGARARQASLEIADRRDRLCNFFQDGGSH
jgi:hypothetical protein